MIRLTTALIVFIAAVRAAVADPGRQVLLRYNPPVGQVARYRMTLNVTGVQTGIGGRTPVRWTAQCDLQEEVTAKQADGCFWVRVSAGSLVVSEANGAFANGLGASLPQLRLCVSPTGAVIETSYEPGVDSARNQAFEGLATQLAPIALPTCAVEPGTTWTADTPTGGERRSRLLSLAGTGDSQIARISSVTSSPLALEKSIAELGLATRLTGDARQISELDMLVGTGLVRRHKGSTHLRTRCQVSLSLPDRTEVFAMESDLTIAFELKLLSVDGKPVSPT